MNKHKQAEAPLLTSEDATDLGAAAVKVTCPFRNQSLSWPIILGIASYLGQPGLNCTHKGDLGTVGRKDSAHRFARLPAAAAGLN